MKASASPSWALTDHTKLWSSPVPAPSWRFPWETPLCHVGDRSLVTCSKKPSPFWHRLFLPTLSQESLPHYSVPSIIACVLTWSYLLLCISAAPLPLEYTIHTVQSLSHVQLLVTPWIAAHQASLSITNSRSLLKLMSIESVMPSNHLILHHPLLLLPSIFPSIRVFSNESVLHIRWPKYWSFSFSISPSDEQISFRMDCFDLLAVQGTLKSLLQHHSSKSDGTRCHDLHFLNVEF